MNDHSLLILGHMRNDIARIKNRDETLSLTEKQQLDEIAHYLEQFESVEA